MTLADRDCSGALRTRLPLVVLCAVALGIVGMHGSDSGDHVGHHAAPTIMMTTDTTAGVVASLGVVAADEALPAKDGGGLLALCLMVLTPGMVLGLWLLARAARGGEWRLPRLVPWVVAALDVAGLPAPFERQLTVLRI